MKFFFVAVKLNFMFCSYSKVYQDWQKMNDKSCLWNFRNASEQFSVIFAVSIGWHLDVYSYIVDVETRHGRWNEE